MKTISSQSQGKLVFVGSNSILIPPSLGDFAFRAAFFFNDTATTEIYTLSLHDALPIFIPRPGQVKVFDFPAMREKLSLDFEPHVDRKSTRLNSSHGSISYAVFCLK